MQISNYFRNYAIMRTYGRCAYCGRRISDEKVTGTPRGPTFDHVLPLIKNGQTSKENILLCCFGCNQEKGQMTLEEYRGYKASSLQGLLKGFGLSIKATGEVQFYFERLLSTGADKKIEEILDAV